MRLASTDSSEVNNNVGRQRKSDSLSAASSQFPTSDYSSGSEDFTQLIADCRPRSFHSLCSKPPASSAADELFQMSADSSASGQFRVYKLVLTGGPCGGKTTGQDRIATFFENMGWKVFTVPETATVLLRGGVKFSELNDSQRHMFQKDLLLTLLQIEKVFFNQAELIKDRNVLVICDRGAMDPSAYMDTNGWERILKDCSLNIFDMREDRYNQIVHMVTAADGAESHYNTLNNAARFEGLKQAIDQDQATRTAWIGHPYFDIVDNKECKTFNDKILQLIQVVCDRIGLPYQDRLSRNSKKRKWLVKGFDDSKFPKYEEFAVRHDYLRSNKSQVRIRARCQNNRSTYTLTNRKTVKQSDSAEENGCSSPITPCMEAVETRIKLDQREYNRHMAMRDKAHTSLHKRRRCFTFGTEYFHLDIYVDPLPPACQGQRLMILETYTTKQIGDPEPALPDFLEIDHEITGDPKFSMYLLSEYGAKPIFNGTNNTH